MTIHPTTQKYPYQDLTFTKTFFSLVRRTIQVQFANVSFALLCCCLFPYDCVISNPILDELFIFLIHFLSWNLFLLHVPLFPSFSNALLLSFIYACCIARSLLFFLILFFSSIPFCSNVVLFIVVTASCLPLSQHWR